MGNRTFNFAEITAFNWGDLYLEDFEVSNTIDAFRKYISGNEKLIARINVELKAEIENDEILTSKELDEISKMNWYSQHFEIEEFVNNELTRRHRLSTFVSMFSFFEGKLKEVAKKVETKKNPSIKINDLSKEDGYVNQYWRFLIKVIDIDHSGIQDRFQRLQSLQKVRNKIMHENGYIKDERLIQAIEQITGLSLNNSGYLQVDDVTFLESFLKDMETFFKEILKVIDLRFS